MKVSLWHVVGAANTEIGCHRIELMVPRINNDNVVVKRHLCNVSILNNITQSLDDTFNYSKWLELADIGSLS
jgi:hypothetical protein